MFQKLLADRFHLTIHREEKTMPVFVMSVAKGGGQAHGVGTYRVAAPTARRRPPGGTTIFGTMEKNLGVKLEQRKQPMAIIVTDSVDRLPTEN